MIFEDVFKVGVHLECLSRLSLLDKFWVTGDADLLHQPLIPHFAMRGHGVEESMM
jgi:hypothetical protein